MAFSHIDRYEGSYNKFMIGNLYYDKKTKKWRMDIMLGKDNKLTIYAGSKQEMINNLVDIVDAMQQFINTMELIENSNPFLK